MKRAQLAAERRPLSSVENGSLTEDTEGTENTAERQREIKTDVLSISVFSLCTLRSR